LKRAYSHLAILATQSHTKALRHSFRWAIFDSPTAIKKIKTWRKSRFFF